MKRLLFIFISLILLAFTTGDTKSEYILPLKANSVCSADIDLDGDNDIVVGHNYSSSTDWTGITMMINDGNGYFSIDTFYMNGQHRTVLVDKIDDNEEQDLITQYYSGKSSQIGILLNFVENQNDLISIDITYYADLLSKGDINGDGFIDIVFGFNTEQQWGVLYNDGTGNFAEPEYHDLDYPPLDIACGDMDGNGMDDIAIAGQNTEIFYSFATGFEYYLLANYRDEIELADMDHDGDIDIATSFAWGETTIYVYENIGDGNFNIHQQDSYPGSLGGLWVADMDNDSLPDIINAQTYEIYLYHNNGGFQLMPPVTIPTVSLGGKDIFLSDIDGNNFIDIVFSRNLGLYVPNLYILFNDGNGNFAENPITGIQEPTPDTKYPIKCYPNPFTTETTIEINIKENEFAELSVYNLSGKNVKTLTNKIEKGGINTIIWNGLDNGDKACKPGPYLLTLKVNGNVRQTIKLIKH